MKRLFGMLSAALLVGSWLLIGGWLLSRLITDRFAWSQYPWWTPTWAVLASAAALLLMALILGRIAKRRRNRRAGMGARVTVVALLAMTAYYAIIECRVYRLPGRVPAVEAAEVSGGLRILFWNPSMSSDADVADAMNLIKSDLAIIANPTWAKPFHEMAQRYGPSWFLMANQFVILSRNRILRWGLTDLGLHGREQRPTGNGVLSESPTGKIDPGCACWLEIDTTPIFGRPIIVWLLDLPSDEGLNRWQTAGFAAAVLRDWRGDAMVPDGGGRTISATPMQGFPTPDVVIGDLNSPRGSASLGRLAPGLHNAYDDGGAGPAATFPRARPLVHIDQVLLAPLFRASDYRILDPGVSRHRMQWTRIEAK